MDAAPTPSDTEPCLCAAVRQAARHLSQHYDAALAPVGLSINQYSVLVRTQRYGPCGIGDLAANLVMDRSTLGHLLRPLQARGLIGLGAAPDDRRRKALTITPRGADLVAEARPLWAAAQRRFAVAYGAGAVRDLRVQLDAVASLTFDPVAPAGATPPAAA